MGIKNSQLYTLSAHFKQHVLNGLGECLKKLINIKNKIVQIQIE